MAEPEPVAVIVVHGVADQKPNESVRQVANLLARVDDASGGPAYATFVEAPIRIPVRGAPSGTAGSNSSFFRASQKSAGLDAGELFTRTVLGNYEAEGPAATFETVRLESARRASDGVTKDLPVHLYEMYWADLSRVGTSAWRILGELYQVLLHMPSLAKHAASATLATHPSVFTTLFQRTSGFAAWTLSVPIAVFNVFFIAAAVLVLASELPARAHAGVALGLFAIGIVAAATAALLRARVGRPLPIVMGLIVAAIVAVVAGARQEAAWSAPLLGIEALIVGLGIAGAVVRSYASHRPGTGRVAVAALLIVLLTAVQALSSAVHGTGSDPQFTWIAEVGFRITESLFVVLVLAWTAFFVALFASFVTGSLHVAARWRARTKIEKLAKGEAWGATQSDRRSVRTVRVALAIPAALFLFLTVALWAGLDRIVETPSPAHAAATFSPFKHEYKVRPFTRVLLSPSEETGSGFVREVLAASLGPGIAIATALLALGALLTIIPLAPIVIQEVFPPPAAIRARNYGTWLSAVFAVLRFTGALTIAGVMALAVVDWVKAAFPPTWLNACDSLDWRNISQLYACALERSDESETVVKVLAALVAGGTAGLMAFRGRLKSLAGGFRAPIDVALDVDGYFREHPKGRAPRARMFARYWSLLNEVGARGYSKVIVVAHSQGTVITADLFRHLVLMFGALPASNVRVFTMGSPLRQLYGRRFPHMYEWAWNETPTSAAAGAAPPIDGKPDPDDIGAAIWVNAYRSGDYIGRWLWRANDAPNLFETDAPNGWTAVTARSTSYSSDSTGTRFERCIGAGAHTHYWDGTAPEIATELDYLIRT